MWDRRLACHEAPRHMSIGDWQVDFPLELVGSSNIGCRGLFTNLLASLNLLEVTQLATGNNTFAFTPQSSV